MKSDSTGRKASQHERSSSASRGYGYRWQKLRKQHLASNPLCVYCERNGVTRLAAVVDHKVPHKGDEGLLYSPSNLQSLCKTCHDSTKQREERTATERPRWGVDGLPVEKG